MHMGFIVFIVFMIVILQILHVLSKRGAGGRSREETAPLSPDIAGGKRKGSSLFRGFQNQGLNRVWMQTAGNYELYFLRPEEDRMYPGIEGESGEVFVRAYVDEGDQDSPPSTVIDIQYKERLPFDFLLMRGDSSILAETMEGRPRLEKLAGILASSRSDFALTGEDPKLLEAFFNPARRNLLEELLESGEFLQMDGEGITWSVPGVIGDEEDLSEILGLLIAAGNIFRNGADELPVPSVKSISPSLPEEKPAVTSPVYGGAPVEEVKKAAAVELPREEVKVEALPEIKEENEPCIPAAVPAEGSIPAVPPEPPANAEENTPAQEEGPSLLLLGRDLFATPFPDAALKKKWEEKKGHLFCGEGIVKTSYDYRSDFVFGASPGVKVTLDLGKIPGKDGRMDVPYRAVISFPAEEKEFFRANQGKMVAFTGKLLKFETFGKEIYLMEGTISGKENNV